MRIRRLPISFPLGCVQLTDDVPITQPYHLVKSPIFTIHQNLLLNCCRKIKSRYVGISIDNVTTIWWKPYHFICWLYVLGLKHIEIIDCLNQCCLPQQAIAQIKEFSKTFLNWRYQKLAQKPYTCYILHAYIPLVGRFRPGRRPTCSMA